MDISNSILPGADNTRHYRRKTCSSAGQGYGVFTTDPAVEKASLPGVFAYLGHETEKSLVQGMPGATGFMRDCLYSLTKSTPPGSNDKISGFLAFSNYRTYPGLFSKRVMNNDFFF